MRRLPWWSALVAAAAVGGGIGAAVAAAGQVQYRAEAKVVVQGKGGPGVVRPLLPNLRELATSSILAGNVDSTLRLPGSADSLRKRLHASVAPGSQVIVLSVSDRKRDRARQIAQEAAVVLVQLVQARFGTGPSALTAAILDPAHAAGRHGLHFARDALIGAAIGFGLAVAGLLVGRRGVVVAQPTDEGLAARERLLQERIKLLTKRERALAKRAGELAKRERAADAGEAKAREARARPVAPPPPVEVAEPAQVAPVQEPERPAVQASSSGTPTLDDLERLVRERRAEFPRQADEWSTYLFHLREHVGPDGRLPSNFSGLVQEVFGELLR